MHLGPAALHHDRPSLHVGSEHIPASDGRSIRCLNRPRVAMFAPPTGGISQPAKSKLEPTLLYFDRGVEIIVPTSRPPRNQRAEPRTHARVLTHPGPSIEACPADRH